jgi:hypothetical protein
MNDTDKKESAAAEDTLTRLNAKVGELESRITRVEDMLRQPPVRQRVPRNYRDYLKVKETVGRGTSINSAAKILKLPYTTVHYYATASPDVVERLKATSKILGMKTPDDDGSDGC